MNLKRWLKNKRNKDFFRRSAAGVAREILGDYLVLSGKRDVLAGKIVETESYPGLEDDASHSFKGKKTPRNQILYQPGGLIYIYLIYGKFWCFNIVVSQPNDPQAVFIRALEPLAGIEVMQKRRGLSDPRKLTNGPGRWTMSFGIDKKFLGQDITSSRIFISANPSKKQAIVSTRRIGVDYATQSRDLPLRFYLKGNPFVSIFRLRPRT